MKRLFLGANIFFHRKRLKPLFGCILQAIMAFHLT